MFLFKLYGISPDKNNYFVHQILTAMFNQKETNAKILFQRNQSSVIVLSDCKPTNSADFYTEACIEEMYLPNIKDITINDTLAFKIRFNPVKRDPHTRKHIGLKNQDALNWLINKLTNAGIDANSIKLTDQYWTKNQKPGHVVTAYVVEAEGVIKINDYETFEKNILLGFGQSKMVGCGLLNIFDVLM